MGENSVWRGFYAIMIHFLVLRVALSSSRWEGDLTFFPPRMNTVLGVTCLSLLALLASLAYFHILVSKTQSCSLISFSRNLWGLHHVPNLNTTLDLHPININSSQKFSINLVSSYFWHLRFKRCHHLVTWKTAITALFFYRYPSKSL